MHNVQIADKRKKHFHDYHCLVGEEEFKENIKKEFNKYRMENKSDKKCAHIIYIPFTGVGLHGGFRGDDWYKHRIKVFKDYTLKSLANQSNKDFIVWCSFRPEEEKNIRTQVIAIALKEKNIPFVFTFNGLMYHDDKFTNYTLKTKARNVLMMLWDCWNQKVVKNPFAILSQAWENKNDTLLERLDKSLKIVGDTIGTDYDWIYLTRLDSDDMLHKDAVQVIQNHKPEYRRSLTFQNGYIYNVLTGQLGEWNPPTNPPFHTIVFPGGVFFAPTFHKDYYKDFKSHEDATRCFNPICMDEDIKGYCVTTHGKQISTAWETPLLKHVYKGYCYTTSGKNISTHWKSKTRHIRNYMIGKEFEGKDKEEILKDYGIYIS